MSFSDDCYRLTSVHMATRPGTFEFVKVPALLTQLSDAVTLGIHAVGNGASLTTIPISDGALSLMQDIEREARALDWNAGGDGLGRLADLIGSWPRRWGDNPGNEMPVKARGWVEAIVGLIEPQKPPRRLLNMTCPSCSTTYTAGDRRPALQIHCWNEDGSMAQIGLWNAECRACGASWSADGMTWLIRALEAKEN